MTYFRLSPFAFILSKRPHSLKNMKKICVYLSLSAVLFILLVAHDSFAQIKPFLKRTTYKTESVDFGVGGTVSIVGAPNGAITVEGWLKNEVEITAEIEVQGATESDLAQLAQISTYILDESFGHLRISSVGVYDKQYVKSVAKKFPKNLMEMPLKIDYKIKVPTYCDLEIDGGNGDLTLSNVEGAMRIKVLESNAKLNLVGGTILATFGKGNVDVTIPNRSWRGRSADIQLATGIMNVKFPPNLTAFVYAQVLRTGQIESSYDLLKPRERAKFTDKSINAKAGNGGAQLSFTVGDGTLKIGEIDYRK